MSRPSYKSGFATHSQSAHPWAWQGVIAAWCPSLGATGVDLRDNGGRSRHGTLQNFTLADAWASNEGLVFTGGASSEFVSTPLNLYDMGIRQHATISAWVRSDVSAASRSIVGDWKISQGLSIRVNAGDTLTFFVYPNNHRITSTETIIEEVWSLVTGVMDGANMRLYLNADEIGTQTLGEDIGDSTGVFEIGARGDSTAFWDGLIDDVKVYNRVEPVSRIRQLYELGPGGAYSPARRSRARVAVAAAAANYRTLLGVGT